MILILIVFKTKAFLENNLKIIVESIKEITIKKWFQLVGIGTAMILVGAPIVLLELSIGINVK